MAVHLYFGLPGCGKTTIMTKIAYDAVMSYSHKNIYCNVPLTICGVTYVDNSCIGRYILEDCLVLIDEASLYADSRDHANFSKGQLTYFLEHRHFHADIYLFTQQWDGVDRKIRVITDRVYYVYKDCITGGWFSRYYRIPYGIIIPDPKKGADQKLGEIIQGYCKPNFLVRLFSPWVYRPKYYKYFDSWSRPDGFHPLPERYKPHFEITSDGLPVFHERTAESLRKKAQLHKVVILLRSIPHRVVGHCQSLWKRLSSLFVKENKSSSS